MSVICQNEFMNTAQHQITPKLVDSLYTEAMLLADEARSYFDSERARNIEPNILSVAFSCESLKVTTRLMHIIAWLLNQKAIFVGEISTESADSMQQLGYAPASEHAVLSALPEEASTLIAATEDLYYRVQRFSQRVVSNDHDVPATHAMLKQLEQAF